MKLHHERTLDAPLDRVWERAKDVRVVAAAFPGGEITKTEGDEFTGRVSVRVGLLTLTYDGQGRIEEVDEEAHRAVIAAKGRQRMSPARADIRMALCLEALSEEQTRARLDTHLVVNGASMPLAGPLGERIASPLVAEFLDRLGAVDEPVGGGSADVVGSFLRHFAGRRSS